MEADSGRDLDRFFERWIYDIGIPRVRYGRRSKARNWSSGSSRSARSSTCRSPFGVTYTDGKTAEKW